MPNEQQDNLKLPHLEFRDSNGFNNFEPNPDFPLSGPTSSRPRTHQNQNRYDEKYFRNSLNFNLNQGTMDN